MTLSWVAFADTSATGAVTATLACRGCWRPTPMEELAPPLVVFMLFTWFCVVVRREREPAGPAIPVCEHCGYDLAGIAFPGRCPECGGMAGGVRTESRTRLGSRGSILHAALIAAAATGMLAPILEGRLLWGIVRWLSPRLDCSMRGRDLRFVEEVHPTLAFVLCFAALFLVALPLTPMRSIRAGLCVARWIAPGMAAGMAAAAALEWTQADYVSPLTLVFRSAVWACGVSMLLRGVVAWRERYGLTSESITSPTLPGSDSPSRQETRG